MSGEVPITTGNTQFEEKPQEGEKKKLRPCCACPETKKARDACIVENGEENCGELIEAHKECMRQMGFNIWYEEIQMLSAVIKDSIFGQGDSFVLKRVMRWAGWCNHGQPLRHM